MTTPSLTPAPTTGIITTNEGTALSGTTVNSDPIDTKKYRRMSVFTSFTGTVTAGATNTYVSADAGTTWHNLAYVDGVTSPSNLTFTVTTTAQVVTFPCCAGLTRVQHQSVVGAMTVAKARYALHQEE